MRPNEFQVEIPLRDEASKAMLRTAQRITAKAQVNPYEIQKRMYSLAGIFGGSLVGMIATSLAIWTGAFTTAASQQLGSFLVLGCIGIAILSLLGLLVVSWSGLLYEHVQRVAVESELLAPTALAEHGIAIWYDPEFTEKVAAAIIMKAAPQMRMDLATAKAVAVSLVNQGHVTREMADLYCASLANRTGERELINELRAAAEG